MDEKRYAIRLVSNPYIYSDGDFWSTDLTLDLARTMFTSDKEGLRLPDLHDARLEHQGYPGYRWIDIKLYEMKEVDSEILDQ